VRSNPVILTAFIPTLSVLLRFSIDRNAMWLQYAPVAAACVWALWYFWTRRVNWSWLHNGALLLLVSDVFAPHAWFIDEVVVLPAILAALYAAKNSRTLLIIFVLMSAIALLELEEGVKLISPYYIWTAPAWLVWYLIATNRRRAPIADSRTV
jgi:hypothetical protein